MSLASSSDDSSIEQKLIFKSENSLNEHLIAQHDLSEDEEENQLISQRSDQTDGPTSLQSAATIPLTMRSYSKWAPSQQGATLVWRDVCVYANLENNQLKRIINNSTGAIQPGTLLALMGSSGAGKSTLMSALAYRNPSGTRVQGDILLNGRRIGPFMHRISGFVHQDDLFLGTLTVLEHITFMAHLRHDRRTDKLTKMKLIKELLEDTGLSHCAHTKIGHNDDNKVLSGGERKRLAFATELLTRPTILFCDEPTTGLDSYSAQQLIGTLLSLAKRGTTIMCTIHQPSSQLFAMFHQVLLLADGRVSFIGTPHQALDFFAMNGYICPKTYNPADFLIGILASTPGSEKASQRSIHRLCDLFAVSQISQQRDTLVNLEMHMSESGDFEVTEEEDRFLKPFWIVTIFWLCYRSLLCIFRDPTVQTYRVLQKIAIALMCGLCFFGSIDLTQRGIQSVQGALFVIISENTFGPLYSVLAVFPQGFPLFIREKRSGLYDTVQYYLANIISMIPGLILEPLIFVVVGYWLTGLRTTFYAFSMTAFIAILVMNVATSCGCFFSTAFNSVPLAMAYVVPFDYILMITSGVFVKLSSISPYWSWMQYLSWLMYANEAMSIIQWEGIQNITCYGEDMANNTLPCLHTGAQVLDQYSFMDGNLHRDIWAMIVLYGTFNGLALFCLWRRARKMC